MSDEILTQLRRAVDATAAALDRRGSAIRERELEIVIEAALRTLGLDPRRQESLRLSDAWCGRVGGVDLVIDGNSGSRILIELKWDPTTLAACAWDSMKLAAALQAGEGERAFLVAGSPELEPRIRGDELLDDGVAAPAELRQAFANEFDYWKRDVKNHPKRVPAGWHTRLRHSASLTYKEAPWRIRIAELILTARQLVSVE